MPSNRVAILGTGLIGSSIGLALKAARPQTQIAGYDASGENLRRAQAVKAIDRRASLRDALADAELVIISTPVGAMKALFEEIAPLLPVQALVMDTGSTKATVLQWAADLLPNGVRFVGSHPMAGSEKRGVQFAQADLFERATCVVTPDETTDPAALSAVEAFWSRLGMRTVRMSPEQHDLRVAEISHLPHTFA